MGDPVLKHKDRDTYLKDLRDAIDEFEDALLWRYEEDLYHLTHVWTTHGEEPKSTTPTRAEYLTARDYAPAWAAEARDEMSNAIADYGTHDLNKLESAFLDLQNAASLLGEERAPGETNGLPATTNDLNTKCDYAWGGASGEAFKDNFGNSAGPTLDNQKSIATNLYVMYSARACIIDSVRRNTINAFKNAATALRETEDSGEEADLWFFIAIATIPIGIGAITDKVIAATEAVAGLIDSKNPDQQFSNDIKSVMKTLKYQLEQAGFDANGAEDDLLIKVVKLQQDIEDTKSRELELYNFTEAEYSPSGITGGFEVTADNIYDLAALCLNASEGYEQVITSLVSADGGDGELKGEDYVQTSADKELIDTKDALVSFAKTTCARYYEAADRLHETARTYFGVEADSEDAFKGLEEDPDLNGSDQDGKGGSVDKHVKKSNRDDIEDLTDSVNTDPPYVHG